MFFLHFKNVNIRAGLGLLLVLVFVTACKGQPTPTPAHASPSLTVTGSNTAGGPLATGTKQATAVVLPTMTLTSEPLAASVNGEGITLADFKAELARYQAAPKASGVTPLSAQDQQTLVLNDMVDNLLLAQAAVKAGHLVTDQDVQTQIAQLVTQLGSKQALSDWENQHSYTDAGFRQSLVQSIQVAWQRDQILSKVPETADQVHVRQILVYNETDAQIILQKLQSGADFATLAVRYDPVNGGDLDWFPQGFLTIPEVDQAAFSLQPGKISGIIKSKVGYHIIQVIARDPQHPLTPQTRAFLQKQALQKWLENARAQSKVETYLNP